MKKVTDIILELYKNENITKEEADILLNAIWGKDCCYSCRYTSKNYPPNQTYADWSISQKNNLNGQ